MKQSYFPIQLSPSTQFIFSTSGSANSIERHNQALQKIGLDLVYFSFPHDITAKEYAELLRSPICRGGAVTGKDGLKSNIIPFLNEVEPIAQKMLAVNTVVNKNGHLHGYNTDAIGLKTALENALRSSPYKIKTAVIYGNGGVSGVAYHVLRDLGIEVMITGRNPQKVRVKRANLGMKDEEFNGPCDLVVDATPISSDPNFLEAKGFAPLLKGCKIVFSHNMPEKDNKINYLKSYCEANDIAFISGSEMYRPQLIRQYQLLISDLKEEEIIENWNL